MKFTQSELELIYQYAMPGGKDATLTEFGLSGGRRTTR